jgi:hypothetical protein
MTINTNLSPYFDDFDPSKHFYKILFKPGYSVQTRELNQLQSIIGTQIAKFGSNIFKDGSVVKDGEHSSILAKACVVSSFTGTNDINYFLGKTLNFNGSLKEVVYVDNLYSNNYIFLVDKTSGSIPDSSVLLVNGDTSETYSITVESSTSSILHQIRKGIYFVQGSFVQVEAHTIVVSLSNTAISTDVYLIATESIIDSYQDESLLDNSFGAPNYSAPGADRYAIDLHMQLSLPAAPILTNENHFLLASYRNGIIVADINAPRYSDIEKYIAERSYKESGNYTVDAFIGQINPDLTDITNTIFILDKGDAFINGYEFQSLAPTLLDVPKARTTDTLKNGQVQIDKGPYILVENVSGFISPYDMVSIDIHNSLTVSKTAANYDTTLMGTAISSGLLFDSLNVGPSNTYKLFLSNIIIKAGLNFANAKTFIITSGTGTYTWEFYANYNSETYDTKTITGAAGPTIVTIFNSLNYSNIYTLVNTPIKTHINPSTNENDISYQYYKEFLSQTFERDGNGNTVSNFSLSGNQFFFIGSGVVSSSSVVTEWYAVVKSVGGGSGIAPLVNSIIKLESSTVTILDQLNASISIPEDYTLVVDVYAVMSEAVSTTRNKIIVSNATTLITSNLSNASISLLKADAIKLTSIIGDDGVNYTSYYTFQNGQNDLYYDHSYVSLKNANNTPISSNPNLISLMITFDYYSHTGTGPFTVDSYNNAPLELIPSHIFATGASIRLSDAIDFRPRRTDDALTLIFDSYKRPCFGSILTTDYEYYLPRIDLAVLTKDLKLSIISGIPARYPIVPNSGTSMTLYVLSIPAYTFDYKNITVDYVDNKGYTMKDVAKIDHRVSRLEYYTALSFLEAQAQAQTVPSSVPGINKFQNGILVDSFSGHSVGDVFNSAYNCSIDFNNRILRPAFNSSSYGYTYVDANSVNVTSSNDLVSLNYTESQIINQTVASETESVQPFVAFSWNGILQLDPPADTWTDTQTKPTAIVNMNSANDAYSVFSQGNGQRWSDWATTGVGATNLALSSTLSVVSTATVTL